ncbi:MAG: hypothetical protein UHI81_01825 [Olegusella sp.]|nr:hypothetical protein [Olegusella sp.]
MKATDSPAQKKEVVLGLVVLIAVPAFLIFIFVQIIWPMMMSFFLSLSTLDSAVIVALITATVSIVSYVSGSIINSIMKRNEYYRSHREKPYMSLISLFYDFQLQTKSKRDFTQDELIQKYYEFTKELTLWGSSKAIKAWGNWRAESSKNNLDSQQLLFGMEKVLIQLRKDMGLKRGITEGDLLRLSINDIDDYLPPNKASNRQ